VVLPAPVAHVDVAALQTDLDAVGVALEPETVALVKRDGHAGAGQLVAANEIFVCYVTGKDGRVRVIGQISGASALLASSEGPQTVVDIALAGVLQRSVRSTTLVHV
jgi:hypothetical protein